MKKIFSDFAEMAIHPRRFAEQAVRNRNISILSVDFCAAFTVFILYSILSSVVMYLTPSGSVSALAGVPVNMEFPLWKIITVSFCGALFTMAGLASLLCVIIPFISKGRLSLRLPTLLILVPAVYFVFFLIPGVPAPVRNILAVSAAAAVFVPAFRKKDDFMRFIYCFFAVSAVFMIFQLLLLVPVCRFSTDIFTFLYILEGILSIIYFVNFCMAFSGLSAAKAAAAIITAVVIVYVIIWSVQFSGLISPEVAQILMLS